MTGYFKNNKMGFISTLWPRSYCAVCEDIPVRSNTGVKVAAGLGRGLGRGSGYLKG